MMKKLYLDNDVLTAMRKDDMPVREASPISLIEAMADAGVLSLWTSEVSKEELDKWQSDKKPLVMQLYQLLPQVPYEKRQKFLGMNIYGDRFTWINSPRIEDHRIWHKLRTLGLKDLDAHQLMMAIVGECDVFLTGNWHDFGCRRPQIKQEFPEICILRPSEALYHL